MWLTGSVLFPLEGEAPAEPHVCCNYERLAGRLALH